MGKNKHTFISLLLNKQVFYKELIKYCENDCINVLQNGGLQKDLYKECWLKGFQNAERYITKLFELLDEETKYEKTKK